MTSSPSNLAWEAAFFCSEKSQLLKDWLLLRKIISWYIKLLYFQIDLQWTLDYSLLAVTIEF